VGGGDRAATTIRCDSSRGGVAVAPQPPDVAAERLREQGERDGQHGTTAIEHGSSRRGHGLPISRARGRLVHLCSTPNLRLFVTRLSLSNIGVSFGGTELFKNITFEE
jgi:hypothetical protein